MNLSAVMVTGEQLNFKTSKNSCIIGRSSTCDFVIPHEGMSRQHCLVELIDGELFVTDLGSTNGVMIDGERIPPNKKTPYATFLSLSFGAVQNLSISGI